MGGPDSARATLHPYLEEIGHERT